MVRMRTAWPRRRWHLGWVVGLSLLPWLAVLMGTSGPASAALFLATLGIQLGLGFLLLLGVVKINRYPFLLMLAPGAGYIVLGSTIAFGVRGGMDAGRLFWTCVAFGVVGLGVMGKRVNWRRLNRAVRRGYVYPLLSLIICGVYFIPPATRDAVVRPDGSFQWMYVDTQYSMAVTVAVMNAVGVPSKPGFFGSEHAYHYGAPAIAAGMSAAVGIPVRDSHSRVLRALAQFSLLISALGLGFILARLARLPLSAAIGSPILLFFYGSSTALLTPTANSSSLLYEALLFNVPELRVQANGGPFAHLLLGHSQVHGSIALCIVLSIVLLILVPDRPWLRWPALATVLPALAIPMNSFVGAASGGLLAAAFLISDPQSLRRWTFAVVSLLGAFVGYFHMGFLNSPSVALEFDSGLFGTINELTVWFIAGLGARTILFSAAMRRYAAGVRVTFVLLLAGFLSLSVLVHDPWWGIDAYGFKFLQASLSLLGGPLIFAVLRPNAGWWNSSESLARDLMGGTFRLALPLAAFSAIGLGALAMFGAEGPSEVTWAFKISLVVSSFAVVTVGLWRAALDRAGVRRRRMLTGLALATYSVGFLAWVPDWLDFGLDRARMAVRVPSVVLEGARELKSTSETGALIATNRHSVPSIPVKPERSYALAALAERPVLLEGWQYGEQFDPRFPVVRADNEKLFHTESPEEFLKIVEDYGIRYVVAWPGSDIRLPYPRPLWLRAMHTPGLNMYAVEESEP